jgi:hypothetical protein
LKCNSEALVPADQRPLTSVAAHAGILVPRVIAVAGDQAARRFLEFFAATICKKNTRMACYRVVVRFIAWCDHHKIGEPASERACPPSGQSFEDSAIGRLVVDPDCFEGREFLPAGDAHDRDRGRIARPGGSN